MQFRCTHHLVRELDTQMAQAPRALNDHNVSSDGFGVPQRVEDSQPCRRITNQKLDKEVRIERYSPSIGKGRG